MSVVHFGLSLLSSNLVLAKIVEYTCSFIILKRLSNCILVHKTIFVFLGDSFVLLGPYGLPNLTATGMGFTANGSTITQNSRTLFFNYVCQRMGKQKNCFLLSWTHLETPQESTWIQGAKVNHVSPDGSAATMGSQYWLKRSDWHITLVIEKYSTILCDKLKEYGVEERSVNWFKSFLTYLDSHHLQGV